MKLTIGRVGGDADRCTGQRFFQCRIGKMRQRLEDREKSQRCQQHPHQDDFLATDPVGEFAEHDKERCRQHEANCHQNIGCHTIDFERLRQKQQYITLTCIPDRPKTAGNAEQRDQHDSEMTPGTEGITKRSSRSLALLFHLRKDRRLMHGHANPHRNN